MGPILFVLLGAASTSAMSSEVGDRGAGAKAVGNPPLAFVRTSSITEQEDEDISWAFGGAEDVLISSAPNSVGYLIAAVPNRWGLRFKSAVVFSDLIANRNLLWVTYNYSDSLGTPRCHFDEGQLLLLGGGIPKLVFQQKLDESCGGASTSGEGRWVLRFSSASHAETAGGYVPRIDVDEQTSFTRDVNADDAKQSRKKLVYEYDFALNRFVEHGTSHGKEQ